MIIGIPQSGDYIVFTTNIPNTGLLIMYTTINNNVEITSAGLLPIKLGDWYQISKISDTNFVTLKLNFSKKPWLRNRLSKEIKIRTRTAQLQISVLNNKAQFFDAYIEAMNFRKKIMSPNISKTTRWNAIT